jgi:hydroxyacylglutathione hydrolase
VLRKQSSESVFLIDCGGFQSVKKYLKLHHRVSGIFLTHYHYDHIYFLNEWIKDFPDLIVFGSQTTMQGLSDEKINLSFYHEKPVKCRPRKFQIVEDGETINLSNVFELRAHVTEGHCAGCVTYALDNYIFTGDALIPNIPIVTKLKTGSKVLAVASVNKIKNLTAKSSIICPGHLEMTAVQNVEWSNYT